MVFVTVATVVLILVTSVVLFLKRRMNYWQQRNVFTLPPSILFGNCKDVFLQKVRFGEDSLELHRLVRERRERYAGYYLLWRPVILVADLDLLRCILSKDFHCFTDHLNYFDEECDPLTGHLFTLKGAKWKALRAKLTPTFTSGKVKAMFQTLVDCTKDLSLLLDEAVEQSEPIDIREVFARYTTDVIGSCAFGIHCNCMKNPNTEFRQYGNKAFRNNKLESMWAFAGILFPEKLLKLVGYSVSKKDVEAFFMKLVKDTIEYRQKNNIVRKDFMQLLMDLKNKELVLENGRGSSGKVSYYQNGLSLSEITAQAFVFFIAGFETSSTTLNFLVFELAINPDIQEKLRKEVLDTLAKYDGEITYEGIMEMSYLDKCVQETLRKYPPLPVLLRECTKDYQVPNSDLVIEKGTAVFIHAFGIHHDPEYYPDPERFDPERFSEENKGKRPPYTFLAFGEGPRLCIGLRFGVLQVKVGLVALLRRYRFTLNPRSKTPIEYDPATFILCVKGGVWINLERLAQETNEATNVTV